MAFLEYLDEIIILLAAVATASIPAYKRIRLKYDSEYKTTRQMIKDLSKAVEAIDTRQGKMLDTQISIVQETFGRAAEYWECKGYITSTHKRVLEKLRIAYAAEGGNDLVGYFWDRIDALPVKDTLSK